VTLEAAMLVVMKCGTVLTAARQAA